jgi:heat shock protein HslJ
VNRFTSSVDMDRLRRGEFAMKPAASTKMAGPPDAMRLEDRFLEALGAATGFRVEGESLTLTKGAEPVMRLVRGS